MIILVAAVAENSVIGNKNDLPWYIPEDLKRFRQLTLNKTVVMGRRTYESIVDKLGHPLKDRNNVVITHDLNYKLDPPSKVYNSLDASLSDFKNKDVYIIGGASIYAQTIDRADKLYITKVNKQYEGDALFPKIDKNVWREIEREDHGKYSFVTYERAQ